MNNFAKPKIGKLYRLKHYENAADFSRYIGPDNFGQQIYSALTTIEQILLVDSIMMLVEERKKLVSFDKQEISWVFLTGKQLVHTNSYKNQEDFGNIFIEAKHNNKHVPTWKHNFKKIK